MSEEEKNELQKVRESIVRLEEAFRMLGKMLRSHMEAEEAENEKIFTQIAAIHKLVEAFPVTPEGEPDIHGHRNDHETRMESARTSRQFWNERMGRVLDAVLMGVMVVLVLGIKEYLSK